MMLGTVLLLLAAQSAAEPARTVNDQELGPAEEFTNDGPAVVCMRDLVIRPRAGQSVQLGYSGIHAGTLRLFLENGKHVDFTDGEIFRDQRRAGQGPAERRDDMRIFLVADEGPDVRYQLEGTGEETADYSPPRVIVDGPGVAGNRSDHALFEVVSFERPELVQCDRRYAYGWGVLLEGEPFSIREGEGDEDGSDPE